MLRLKSNYQIKTVYGTKRHIRHVIKQMVADRLRIYDIDVKHVTMFGCVATIKADRSLIVLPR